MTLSIPSVKLFGVVVNVIIDEPRINNESLKAIISAILMPSTVMVTFQNDTTVVPVVNNKLQTTVIIRRKTMVFIPFTMNLKGTVESSTQIARNKIATR